MDNKASRSTVKAVLIAGAALFLALGAAPAQQVSEVRVNPALFIGRSVQVTGLVGSVKAVTRQVHGRMTQLLKFNLYEVDARGRRGAHYIFISLPASQFQYVPIEGRMLTIQGLLKPPYEVAAIDQ
jgi:hypothetical protein